MDGEDNRLLSKASHPFLLPGKTTKTQMKKAGVTQASHRFPPPNNWRWVKLKPEPDFRARYKLFT
jgi:hypothetical protein